MEIKVLGTGCSKCEKLTKAVKDAVGELKAEANIEKVEDIEKIMSYNVLSMPALVINGKVVLSGRVPSLNETKELIQKHL